MNEEITSIEPVKRKKHPAIAAMQAAMHAPTPWPKPWPTLLLPVHFASLIFNAGRKVFETSSKNTREVRQEHNRRSLDKHLRQIRKPIIHQNAHQNFFYRKVALIHTA